MDRNEDLKKNSMGRSCGMRSDNSDSLKNQDIKNQSGSRQPSDSSGIAGSGPVSTMNESQDKEQYKKQSGMSSDSQMKGGCGCGDDDITYTETVFIIEDDPTDM